MISQILCVIGAVTLFHLARTAYEFLTFHFSKPASPLSSYKPKPTQQDGTASSSSAGGWALITGSSAGIGLGIAQELILQGFNVILHGHLPDELASAKDRLLQLASSSRCNIVPPPQVEIRVLDARTATEEELKKLVESISHLDVRILVNNVGGNPVREPNFLMVREMDCGDVDGVLDLNVRFMTRLTVLMIPLLELARHRNENGNGKGKGKALIVNLSSAGMVGVPWLVLYGGSKAFVHGFSVGLGRELKLQEETRHIDCLVVVPGEVKSQGNCRGLPGGAPDWEVFGREVIWKIDGAVERGLWEVRPHFWHGVEWAVMNWGGLRSVPGLGWRDIVEGGLVDVIRRKRDAWWEFKGVKDREVGKGEGKGKRE